MPESDGVEATEVAKDGAVGELKSDTDVQGTAPSSDAAPKRTPQSPHLGDTQPIAAASSSGTKLLSACLTDVGRVREKNEDSALSLERHGLYVVADGMGGHNSGEIASQISVESVRAFFESEGNESMLRKSFDAYRRRNTDGQPRRTFDEYRLWKALEAANLHIFNTARRYQQFRDMGTTVVATHFVGARVYIGYVGDSRVYRIRKGRITQLTEDHSLANEYVKMKILRKEDLPRFPYKNVIVRALGLQERVKIDTFYKEARADDIFLLCSDGLTDLVGDDEILEMIQSSDTPAVACRKLVDESNARGGVDNITALIVQVGHVEPKSKRRSNR